MRNKIFKILIPQRDNLEKKWWHRLFNVMVYTSTVIVAIFVLGLIFSGSSWREFSYIYSFESNYSITSGKENACKFTKSGFFDPIINCGNLVNETDFLNRYAEATRNGNMLMKLRAESKAYNNLMINELIDAGELNNVKIKSSYEIMYPKLFKNLSIGVLLIFAWFIFWESIMYRVVLYIIYGKE